MPTLPTMNAHTLDHAPAGSCRRVVALDDSQGWAASLRRLGFHEGVEVEVLSGCDPVMVRCQNGRVALRRCMLGCVQVCAMGQSAESCSVRRGLRGWLRRWLGGLGRR